MILLEAETGISGDLVVVGVCRTTYADALGERQIHGNITFYRLTMFLLRRPGFRSGGLLSWMEEGGSLTLIYPDSGFFGASK